MGNSKARTYDVQQGAFFAAFPEDILALLTDLLSTRQFINLIATCKYYYQDFLGGNNMLWSRVCHSLGGVEKILKELKQYHERFDSIQNNRDRTNKGSLASIDFKKEISEYYVLIVNCRQLRKKIDKYLAGCNIIHDIHYDGTDFTNTLPNHATRVLPYSILPVLFYWTRADLKSNKYKKDYFYEVDLTYDPLSVEECHIFDQLPHEIGGRIVVYKNSTRKAVRRYDEYVPIPDEEISEIIRNMYEILKEQDVTYVM